MSGHEEAGLRERKKRKTRVQILAAARSLFAERGYDEASLGDIAERAEVSVRTLFSYFPSKLDIFFEGYDEIVDDFIHWLEQRPSTMDAIDAAAAWNADIVARWSNEESTGEQLWRFELRRLVDADPTLAAHERARSVRAEVALARALEADLGGRPDDPRPRLVAAAYLSLMFSFTRQYPPDRFEADRDALQAYIRTCGRALADAILAVPAQPLQTEPVAAQRGPDGFPRKAAAAAKLQ